MKSYCIYTLGLILLACATFTACMEEEDAELQTQLVVEGWIEDGGYPVVLLGETHAIDAGMQNKYTTFKMTGQAGKTYTLTAEYRGKKATAVTTIPQPVELDSLHVVRSESDTLFYIKAFFEDNPDERNYYGLFSKRHGKDKAFLLSFMGVFSNEVIPTHVAADVYCGTSVYTEADRNASAYFKKDDLVQVKLCRMNQASYEFWKSYSNLNNLSSNMFFPYTNDLESNVQGGKGYWCGYGASTLSVRIR